MKRYVYLLACLLLAGVVCGQTTSAPIPLTGTPQQTDVDKPAQDPTTGIKKDATDAPITKSDLADAIKTVLDASDKHPDFELSLGIGSLVNGHGTSDYTNQSNILQATNLGRASPQYLVGVSLRTPYPNFGPFGHSNMDCQVTKPTVSPNAIVPATPPAPLPATSVEPPPRAGTSGHQARTRDKSMIEPHYLGTPPCDYWRRSPWKAFINLKFASGSSQTLNGFVLGGSYQFGHYVDALVGFGFTPFNEASPGLRTTASQFVTAQQKLGNYLNFDANAMLLGQKNAFDGFSLTDSSGKLIYAGNPLEVHFRGGVVIGVAIPITFSSVFTSKGQ